MVVGLPRGPRCDEPLSESSSCSSASLLAAQPRFLRQEVPSGRPAPRRNGPSDPRRAPDAGPNGRFARLDRRLRGRHLQRLGTAPRGSGPGAGLPAPGRMRVPHRGRGGTRHGSPPPTRTSGHPTSARSSTAPTPSTNGDDLYWRYSVFFPEDFPAAAGSESGLLHLRRVHRSALRRPLGARQQQRRGRTRREHSASPGSAVRRTVTTNPGRLRSSVAAGTTS